ncbi:hypothetical protein MAM1_0024d02014 [Mucor ambiguus]|uniref:Uncharacterized protein n=1 Tax=Mucor ambiguus TaxID=91626 RepID=A0A0C9LS61_9FUNG|nr:hypothetical protein MAM1_0024d02014 [Mucor ambiguus]
MLTGELTNSQPLTEDLEFRIIGKSLSLQAKAMDSGLRPNLFVANYALMYYFIRFFKKKDEASLRWPFPNVDEDNNLIPSEAIRMVADNYDNKEAPKLKYMIYRYVWENLDNEEMVDPEKVVKESFARYLSDMHDDLCDANLIIGGEMLNPERSRVFVQRRKSASGRLRPPSNDVGQFIEQEDPAGRIVGQKAAIW